MKRMKVYDVPHKGLRNALGQLQLLASKTDYTNHEEVAAFHKLGEDVFTLLNSHAKAEDEVTLAELEERCAGAAQEDMDDHVQIHEAQHKLEQLLATIYAGSEAGTDVREHGEEFYLAFSEFYSAYLAHTAEEERVTQPLLWQHFTDEELAGHVGKILSRMPPPILLKWFRFIIPAQNIHERVDFLSKFKQVAPEPFYHESMKVIEQALSDKEFTTLTSTLG